MRFHKSDLPTFVRHLMGNGTVFAPTGARFERIRAPSKVDLAVKTDFSPKFVLFPDKETVFRYRKGRVKDSLQSLKPGRTILLGARPCDMNAISYTDLFFSRDPFYARRRDKLLIVGLQCTEKFNNCYCDFTDTWKSDNFDVLLVEKGDEYLVETGSTDGEKLLKGFRFSSSSDKELSMQKAKIYRGFKPAKGKISIDNALVDRFSKRCYNCEACTVVCPTCTCFGLRDEINDDMVSGSRLKEWNSCQTKSFTRVAGGFVFRPDRHSRVDQRIRCKLEYSLERDGMMSCTGCGRCVEVCNADINMFRAASREGLVSRLRGRMIPRASPARGRRIKR